VLTVKTSREVQKRGRSVHVWNGDKKIADNQRALTTWSSQRCLNGAVVCKNRPSRPTFKILQSPNLHNKSFDGRIVARTPDSTQSSQTLEVENCPEAPGIRAPPQIADSQDPQPPRSPRRMIYRTMLHMTTSGGGGGKVAYEAVEEANTALRTFM
jgi:hypothetical protein